MGNDKGTSGSEIDEFRRHATDRLQVRAPKERSSWDEQDRQRLVHELEVHQIELEMQNEQLRQSRGEMETALEKYTDLYDFAPIGYATIDRDGVIRAANLTGAGLLGIERSRLIGRRFGQFVAADSRLFFTDFLRKVFERPGKASCEVTLSTKGSLPLIVQIDAVAASSGQECRAAIIDISERRRLEEKLETLRADLADRAPNWRLPTSSWRRSTSPFPTTCAGRCRSFTAIVNCSGICAGTDSMSRPMNSFREYMKASCA